MLLLYEFHYEKSYKIFIVKSKLLCISLNMNIGYIFWWINAYVKMCDIVCMVWLFELFLQNIFSAVESRLIDNGITMTCLLRIKENTRYKWVSFSGTDRRKCFNIQSLNAKKNSNEYFTFFGFYLLCLASNWAVNE